jgi:hypothetical protein
MGMIDYLLLFRQVDELAARTAHVHARSQLRLKRDSDSLHAETEALRKDLEELALYSRAAVSLLIDKGLITHAELVQRIEELDGEDGILDGRLS